MTNDTPQKPTSRCRLDRQRRLRSRADFDRVFAAKISAADQHLVVYALPNDVGFCRVGIVVGKKLGNAVTRNRYKRTLRQAFRLNQHQLPPGCDFLLLPRPTAEPSADRYRQSLLALARKLQKRLPPSDPTT